MTARDGLHEASAAYALDALDDAERLEFEDHLVSCATCRREVAELAEAVDGLGTLSDAPPPPPALRASVLAGIVDVPQLVPLPGRPRRALPRVVGADGADGADGSDEDDDEGYESDQEGAEVVTLPLRTPAAVGAPDAATDELALRRASRRTRLLTALVAAVTVVALALGVTVAGLVRQTQSPPTAASSVATVDPALLAAPDAKIYPATLPGGAHVSFVVSKRRNQAAFVGSDLPSPGAGKEYHLWTLRGSTVVRPDSTLPGGAQSVAAFTGPIDESDVLAVNVEPTGSNPQRPTSAVLGAVEI